MNDTVYNISWSLIKSVIKHLLKKGFVAMGLSTMPYPIIGDGFNKGKVVVTACPYGDPWESIVAYAQMHNAITSDEEGEFFYLVYDFGRFNSYPVPLRATINQVLRSIACKR